MRRTIDRRILTRQPGGWEGRMRISGDFDDPLPPEIQGAFEGEETLLGDLFLKVFGPDRGVDLQLPPREPHGPDPLKPKSS